MSRKHGRDWDDDEYVVSFEDDGPVASGLGHRVRMFAAVISLRAKKVKRRMPRRPKFRRDPKTSDWYKWLFDTNSSDPEKFEGKRFRRKFRVPPAEILDLVDLIREDGRWSEACDASGERSIPLEILVMGGVRVLGRAETFDTIAEMSYVSEPTVQRFFHHFTEVVAAKFESDHGPPGTASSLQKVMDE